MGVYSAGERARHRLHGRRRHPRRRVDRHVPGPRHGRRDDRRHHHGQGQSVHINIVRIYKVVAPFIIRGAV